MRYLRNENGVALVTALMLTLVALAITMALLYMVYTGTRMSAAHKSYRNSLDATYGGGPELFAKDLLPELVRRFHNVSSATTAVNSVKGIYPGISLDFPGDNLCLRQKLLLQTSNWASCTNPSKSLDPKQSPDLTFKLRGLPLAAGFNIYTKIVDTVPGNSDASGIDYLEVGHGVVGVGGSTPVMHVPTLYTFEVQGERENSPKEKAILEVLYAY